MSEMNTEYKKIITEIENKISNEEERKFVKDKLTELSVSFVDIIDRLTKITDLKMQQIEEKQNEISTRIANVQGIIDNIESDIYEDDIEQNNDNEDENYEFEVVCPYCNNEFSVDIEATENDEIECPECHNIIELDWNEEEQMECSEGCSHCSANCIHEDNVPYEKEKKEDKNQESEGNKDSNNIQEDDDM